MLTYWDVFAWLVIVISLLDIRNYMNVCNLVK